MTSNQTLLAPNIGTREAFSSNNFLGGNASSGNLEPKGQKVKQSISKIFANRQSMMKSSNSLLGSPNNRQLQDRNANKFNITSLLPHKEALKDLKHVLHFSQFQSADSTTQVADGESFKILKHDLMVKKDQEQPSQIYMQVLDYYYDYSSLRAAYLDAAEKPATRSSFNRFFSPLGEDHLETDYLVIWAHSGGDVQGRPDQVSVYNRACTRH